MRFRPRTIAVEAAIIVLLGLVLAAASLGLLVYEYGRRLHFGLADLLIVAVAGITAAAVVRSTTRLHRRWKKTVGRFTAAAVLCAAAAIAGTLVVMIPSECPGGRSAGRCGIQEAAAWGQVACLAAVVNFMLAGLTLAFLRGVRGVVRDGSAQGIVWIRALGGALRRRAGKGTPDRPRGPQERKGRPTPRRADAERARRERLRGT
jgi:lysylphosphatidylglycerol synthetase-like protein (DUF2156 family)